MFAPLPVRLTLSLLLPLVAGLPAAAAATTQEIAKAVEQLASPSYRLRQKASAFLWGAGKAAEPALQKALKSGDREVARRAREILEKFKYGIYPDTPRNVVELIGRYRTGGPDVKQTVIGSLRQLGKPGHAALVKLAAAEEDAAVRKELVSRLIDDLAPGLIADGRYDEVEQLLELGLKDEDEQAVRNYAAFLVLTGRLESRLPAWTARAKKLTGFRAAEVLTYLYRARGDLAAARKAANRTGKKWLLASILYEQADWKELAANAQPPYPDDSQDPLMQLSYMAAFHRLAGNPQAFEKALALVRDYGNQNPGYQKRVGIALLLNDRPAEAIDLLAKGSDKAFVFELLGAQHRYKEALDLAEKHFPGPLTGQGRENLDLGLALARTQALLGDKDKASQTLGKLADDPRAVRDLANFAKVIETETQLGLTDLAAAHCVRVLGFAEKTDDLDTPLGKLFPERGHEAAAWWKFFRHKYASEHLRDVLKRVRQVMEKKLPAKDLLSLAGEMEQAGRGSRARRLLALGETCLEYGKREMAQGYLARAGTREALTRLGDLQAGKKLWRQAAESYDRAWRKDRSRVEALYLRGWALKQAGLKEEGQKAMDLAHLIPLANDEARFKLAQALDRHGLSEAATREREFLIRTGRFRYAELSNSLRLLGLAAYAKKEFDRAAEYQERTMLECLGYVYFVKPGAYLSVPAGVHHIRARGLLARGKVNEALKEVRLALAGVLGDLETVIQVLPDLEKRHRTKEADALFNPVFDHFEKVCRAYPKSAQLHNSLAWLAVSCRRKLDDALGHAKQAVRLAPDSPGYLDTLAEVYYQQGDKARALGLMKKCLRMDPKSDYYHKQIKRFKAPGPPSETPR